jgi:hypothetical protein
MLVARSQSNRNMISFFQETDCFCDTCDKNCGMWVLKKLLQGSLHSLQFAGSLDAPAQLGGAAG